MRKFLSIFAAALVALTVNAAVINIDNTTADALRTALSSAASGDEIVMAAGTYVESNGDYISFAGKDVTVKAAQGAEVLIQPQVPIQVTEGGCAHFVGVKFDASRIDELANWYEHLIYSADAAENNRIVLDGCEIYNFNLNKSLFYCSASNKLAAVTINNCYIHNTMKSVLFVENTTDAINVQVTNSTFANIATNTESYWAGIIDLRNAAAQLLVDHCTFYNVIPMNTDYSCVSKITLANGAASNCIFMLPTAQDGIRAMRGVAATNCITYNYLKDSGTGIHSSVTQTNCVQADPLFVDAANGNYTLGANSPALTMNDGQPIGDPRWAPAAPALENGFYLVGTINNWTPAAEYHLVANPDNAAEFMVTATLAEGDGIKICNVANDNITAWYPDGTGNEYVVDAAHAGEKTIYFQPDYKADWAAFGGYMWIDANAVAPVVDFTKPFTLKFNGNGTSDNSNSFNVESGVAAIFDEASAPYVSALTTVANVYAARTIADDPSSLKFGTSSKKGTLAFTLGQAIEVDSIIVNATQYGNDAAEVTVNGVVFALTAGNKIPTDCKITPTGTVSEITIAQTGSQRIYVRYVKVYPKTGGETPVEPTLPQVGLGASFNAWDWTTNLLTPAQDELTASITVALEAGNHEFKIVSDGSWLSLNGEGETLYGIHREWTRVEHINLINDGRNFSLNADVAGDYTFTWTYADSTLVVTFPEAPVVSTCDWANIDFLGSAVPAYANQFKLCKEGEQPGVVNIQESFGTEAGIYVTFPSAAFSEISLAEGQYAVQGAGMLLYVSAFTALETEVTVVCDNNPIVFTVYNAAYEPQPAVPAYYLVGNMTEWAVVADDAHKFAANAEAEGEFMLTYTLAEGDQFKVVKVEEGQENVWYPGGENNNYVVDAAHAGEKTIYFRPAGGQEGWHEGVIYVAAEEPVDLGPWEAWFGDANWGTETDSYLTYDAQTGKATAYINQDKAGQWHAQVKYHGPIAEAGKFYHVGLKMKANNAMTGVTIKWVDNVEMLYENASVALEANTEYVYDVPSVAGIAGGNGIMVLDFGSAHAGDIVEIYDVVIEEVAAPTVDLADGYYVIGLNGWTIYDLTAADKFEANADAEGEYVITKTLAAGNEFKVVAVAENALGAWFPGEAGNYVVDNAHAGEAKAIYFRPNYDGGEDWHAGCIFVPANEGPVSPIQSTWFANTGWAEEHESTIVWDPETDKITITVAVDKNAQWQGQVKLFTPTAEEGKCYNVTFKLKANNAVTGITFKWQDNNNDPNLIYENQSIALEANTEYVYNQDVAGIPGNGIAVFDFGFAKAGDIIEIYDFAITEIECPEPPVVEVNYYLVGSMTNWAVVAEDAYKFAANAEAEGEYMLSYTLAEGDQFKVVKVEGETQTWYPDGMDNNYVVDAQHAGAATIYFRPAGGVEGWHYGYIYVDTTNGINNTTIDAKAQKFIMNGQLYIIKNGVMYNAQGAVVR